VKKDVGSADTMRECPCEMTAEWFGVANQVREII
jgi:hypothetical protein